MSGPDLIGPHARSTTRSAGADAPAGANVRADLSYELGLKVARSPLTTRALRLPPRRGLRPADLWLIEVYNEGREVRVYSRWFIDHTIRTRQGEIRLNPIC